jgi:hypothetical protein
MNRIGATSDVVGICRSPTDHVDGASQDWICTPLSGCRIKYVSWQWGASTENCRVGSAVLFIISCLYGKRNLGWNGLTVLYEWHSWMLAFLFF